jgi:hypothetical protein
MGYGYAETFLIVFLTHPGVIVPTLTSVGSRVMNAVPSNVAEKIPPGIITYLTTFGFPGWISGLWQVLWFWILSLPERGGPALGWTFYTLYLFFLAAYAYLIGRFRISWGV